MQAIFSQACDFGGMTGHGVLALATVKPFIERGFLKRFICFTHRVDFNGTVKSVPLGWLQKNAMRALGSLGFLQQAYILFDNSFDLLSSRMVSSCDLFFGWQHHSLHSMRKAKRLGAKTLLENPPAHIEEYNAILEREIKKLGLRRRGIPGAIIKKTLKEYNEADFVIVQSSFAAESFLKRSFPAEKLVVVPAGADTERFRPAEKCDEKFRVAFAGRVCFEKGVHYLLEAWEQLGLCNAELLLCGNVSSDSRKLLEKYRSNPSIKFLGFINPAALLPQCDAFVMPSLQDGFCMAVAEAMSCALPVIVSENTGAKDMVKDGKNGFIVETGDIAVLVEKIELIYNNTGKCRRMGKAARETALQFDLNNRGEKLLQELAKRGLLE